MFVLIDIIGEFHSLGEVHWFIFFRQETITGNLPYHDIAHELAVIMAIAIKKKLPERPDTHIPADSEHGDTLWSLLTECWLYEPGHRPSAAEVRDKVRFFL